VAGYEVGSAFLTIMPSAKGFAGNLGREIDGPMQVAGRRGGEQLGDGVAKGGKASFVGAGKSLGGAFAGAFAAFGAGVAIAAVADYIGSAIGAASDLGETINKSSVIFGRNADEIERWAEGAAQSAGLAKGAALEAAAGFGNMFTQLGFASDTAADMSTSVVQLAADLGSFNNLPTAEVADMISAALRGEYDSLQRLIPNINAARVESQALADTGKTTAAELTAAEKAAATLAIIYADGAAATGDFARTSDSLANSQKILQADLENVRAEIGTALLPVVTDLLKTFRDEGVPVLKQFAAFVTQNKDEITSFALATVDGGLLIVQALLGIIEHAARLQEFWLMVSTNMVQAWLNVVEGVINGAVAMFGWVPGVGDKLRTVQSDFGKLRDDADIKFSAVRAAAAQVTEEFNTGQAAVQRLRDGIKSIDGMRVQAFVDVSANDSRVGTAVAARTGEVVGTRATGGPVAAGLPYLVGEREAEIFVPDRPGMIYNQAQMAAMGIGSREVNYNLNVDNYGRDIGPADLVQAARSLAVLDPDW
jgi:hypothetical protein